VLAAQAVILGTTENLGYMSGALKDFFDRSYNALPRERTQGTALRALHPGRQRRHRHAARRRDDPDGPALAPVQEPLMCKGPWQPAFVDQCEELGAAMAAGSGRRHLLSDSELLRRIAAIDDETGAGHEAGIVRREEDDPLGDVVSNARGARSGAC
jgi:hypothetical protein